MRGAVSGKGGDLSTERLLDEYVEHVRTVRDLTDSSIRHHRLYASRFLNYFEQEGSICLQEDLAVGSIQDFVSSYAGGHGPLSNRWMFSTLRVLLGYLYQAGHLRSDLSPAVPSIQCRRLSYVPRGIGEGDIERRLGSIDRSEAVGKRDYAMILLLDTYGVRGAQVRRLRLVDVRWDEDRIVFQPAKGGKRIIQYLTAAVGNSLLDVCKRICAIRAKKTEHKVIEGLSEEEVEAILRTIPSETVWHQRDYALLLLMYNTLQSICTTSSIMPTPGLCRLTPSASSVFRAFSSFVPFLYRHNQAAFSYMAIGQERRRYAGRILKGPGRGGTFRRRAAECVP